MNEEIKRSDEVYIIKRGKIYKTAINWIETITREAVAGTSTYNMYGLLGFDKPFKRKDIHKSIDELIKHLIQNQMFYNYKRNFFDEEIKEK